ncbi:hypothetical protein [Patulibacter sp.]|uniref:hypothetical protein n=1 Tax=Patulibacter sp. TaxID=1912859 RepID=UPI00272488E8|nr:hypothetical protein [Patulibacter sp.]MDO9408377.1 hypothetical protein [Patulibacter sp.]
MSQQSKRMNPTLLLPLFVVVAFLLVLGAVGTSSTAVWAALTIVLLAAAATFGASAARAKHR